MEASDVRRIDLFAALSLATDLALGQPQQFALKSCVLGVRLGAEAGADDRQLSAILYQSLLRYVGCNADTYLMAALLGDEYDVRRDFARIDSAVPREVLGVVIRAIRRQNAGAGPAATALAIVKGLARAPGESSAILRGHCEVAERIAARLGLEPDIRTNLGQLYARWDGRGIPAGLKGEDLSLPVRVVTLAQDAIVLVETFGLDEAVAIVAGRKGGAYDPGLVAIFVKKAQALMADLGTAPGIDLIRALEPPPRATLTEAEIDAACLVLADMADMRTPHTIGHSRAGGTFRAIAGIAGRHHERLDGNGYHRGLRGPDLSPVARALAAAEAFRNWTETRPHRTALRPEAAAARLNAMIREGAICAEAGAAVLEVAGQRPLAGAAAAGDLTAREVEVLQRLTAGLTVKETARALGVAPKTADNHVQSIYSKLGVTTRAAAVLWAVERGLHRPG